MHHRMSPVTLAVSPAPPSLGAGAILGWMRVRAGFTQAALADQIGLDRTYVAHVEAGRLAPAPDALTGWIDACYSGQVLSTSHLTGLAEAILTVARTVSPGAADACRDPNVRSTLAQAGSEFPPRLWFAASAVVQTVGLQGDRLDRTLLPLLAVGQDPDNPGAALGLPRVLLHAVRTAPEIQACRWAVGGTWVALHQGQYLSWYRKAAEGLAPDDSSSPQPDSARVDEIIQQLKYGRASATRSLLAGLCSDLFTSEHDRAETPMDAEASEADRLWDRVTQAWPGLSPEDQRTIADLVSRMAQWPNPRV